MDHQLVFANNADSGLFNTVTDIAHKILSPDTDACKLCALTHDHFKVRKEWAEFLEGLGAECEFLHREELARQHGIRDAELPAVFRRNGDDLRIWIDAATLRGFRSLDELKALLRERLAATDTGG